MWPRQNRGRMWVDFTESVEEMTCIVCGSRCSVERGVWVENRSHVGPRTGVKDVFTCPHFGKPWHRKADTLLLEARRLNSPRLRELVKLDIVDLLRANGIEYTPEV